MRGERDAAVPCGDCTACCTASQFIHVAPDEHATLSVIPPELLFPAPGFPAGHALMGYDDKGHCPMFDGARCTIYEHRPRTCRAYDCRVFAAADVPPDQPAIAERVAQWRFAHPSAADAQAHDEVKQRAADAMTANPLERAVRAVIG